VVEALQEKRRIRSRKALAVLRGGTALDALGCRGFLARKRLQDSEITGGWPHPVGDRRGPGPHPAGGEFQGGADKEEAEGHLGVSRQATGSRKNGKEKSVKGER